MPTTSLLYFELQLAASLMTFTWDVTKLKLGNQRFLLAMGVSIIAILTLTSLISIPYSAPVATHQINESIPENIDLFIKRDFTVKEIESELSYWHSLLEEQPSHRDILINISQLYRSLGDDKQAIYYWEQARKSDPNNSIFK